MTKISGFTIARNVVRLGYPIAQCVEGLANVCDEVVICYDPFTDDGTAEICRELGQKFNAKLIESRWDMENRKAGTEIGIQTDIAMNACSYDWNLHCQLDEVFHEQDRDALHELVGQNQPNVGGFEFQRVCFYSNPQTIRKDWTIRVVRLTKKGTHTYATLDGHNCVPTIPNHRPFIPQIWIYHYQRFGNPELISKRIRVLDALFHPDSSLVPEQDLPAYDFKTRSIDSFVVNSEEVKDVKIEFLRYDGTHPRAFHSFIYPQEPVRIELGSGPHGIEGFLHVDAVKVGNVDKVADIRDLTWLSINSVDELYTAHAIEHISYTEISPVLKEWYRVLKPGGKLTIKTPDMDFMCRAYVEGIHSAEETMICFYGGFPDYPGGPEGWEKISGDPNWKRHTLPDGEIPNPGKYTEWGAHKALYNFNMLKIRLQKAGFTKVERVVENDWELHVVAVK